MDELDGLAGSHPDHDMNKLTATSEQILQHESGPILSVAFAGEYPPGSDGNECAAEMVAYVRSVLAETNASAILFDLRNLRYTWGDAIGGLAYLLRKDEGFRPSAIVADGPTARALDQLLGQRSILGLFGTKMFSTMPEAISHLERSLNSEPG